MSVAPARIRSNVRLILAAAGLLSISSGAGADSLFTVPVAGTLEPRRLTTLVVGNIDTSSEGNSTVFATGDYNLTRYLSLGATARLTDGVSLRPEGSLQFAPIGKPYAFSVGYANVGVRSFRSQPYAAAGFHYNQFGGYAGVTHDSYGEHAMLGGSYFLTRAVSVQADWISDDDNFLTLGARWQAARDFAIAGGFARANTHSLGNGVFVGVEKDFRL